MTTPAGTIGRDKHEESNSPEDGRHFTVTDVKERLIQNADASTLLLWPPNLFAFTSYILHLSGAYQLVVSPPPGNRKLYHWPPNPSLFEQLADLLDEIPACDSNYLTTALADTLRDELVFANDALDYMKGKDRTGKDRTVDTYNSWTYLVRKSALEWRSSFESMNKTSWRNFRDLRHVMSAPGTPIRHDILRAIHSLPPLLRACWAAFAHLYSLDSPNRKPALSVRTLLCNTATDKLTKVRRRSEWLGAVSLLTMHAIADDACVGWGILATTTLPIDFPSLTTLAKLRAARDTGVRTSRAIKYPSYRAAQAKSSRAQRSAAHYLRRDHTMATIAESRARILPKRHNPDVGITLRSLSSNLAFHRSPIEITWDRDNASPLAKRLTKLPQSDPPDSPTNAPTARKLRKVYDSFTMLLLPFPMQIHTNNFHEVTEGVDRDALDNRKGYGFFRYVQDKGTGPSIEEIVEVIRQARLEETTVDMIVLPESALDSNAFNRLKHALTIDGLIKQKGPATKGRAVSVFIAGVSEPAKGSRFLRNNTVHYGYWRQNGFKTGIQHKHHRWQLNDSQIAQYGLSRALPPGTKWWEAINVERRKVSFLDIGDRITLCPLICEDLARQDPIADLIRHVGPSIVVTILMDGPQHKDRWSSRYAAILSEDPGSAVLALTSFGMVRRWNSPFGRMSRVVALWNDKVSAREIELEEGARGILLTLRVENEYEAIADSRLEMCRTSKIILSDVIQIHPPARTSRYRARRTPRNKGVNRRT